jgi:hypothetical protein
MTAAATVQYRPLHSLSVFSRHLHLPRFASETSAAFSHFTQLLADLAPIFVTLLDSESLRSLCYLGAGRPAQGAAHMTEPTKKLMQFKKNHRVKTVVPYLTAILHIRTPIYQHQSSISSIEKLLYI